MYRVKKIQLKNLLDYSRSDAFKNLEHKPISTLRVQSYINNPNAELEDVVLYMAFDNKIIVGYRTIWRDVCYYKLKQSFGWLSGNWVHDNYRRKGISTLLFNEVYKDWNGELMYTNYAVNSKLLYDKTGYFNQIKALEGTRFYTRFCMADILVKKHTFFKQNRWLLKLLDGLGNLFFDLRFLLPKKDNLERDILVDETWNNNIDLFLENYKSKEFYKREKTIYKWIKDYPWVKEGNQIKEESKKYYFSLSAKTFKNNYYTFYNDNKELTAFLWLSFKDGHLKIPYAYFKNKETDEVVKFILQKCIKERVKTVVVYNSLIEKKIYKKLFYLGKKRFFQNFFATEKTNIKSELLTDKNILSGDGDVVFT